MTAPLAINAGRMFARLDALAAINRQPDGSCCRLALTDADKAGRDLLVRWMGEAGLNVQVDAIGNILGRTAGEGAPVMTGSHIDTVGTGGRFDGAYGVIAGLEVLQVLHEAGVALDRPLVLAAFTNEEGVRFQPDMMGSLVFAGGLPLDDALDARGPQGERLGDELARIGYAGAVAVGAETPCAYVELHIEQGPILDRDGGVLGAVEDLQGISWTEVTFGGVSNHSGTTPMAMRRDAGYAAAQIGVFARELATAMGGSQVATVGAVSLKPNLINVIARQATVTVDLRNTDEARLREAEAALLARIEAVARAEGLTTELRSLARTEPVRFDAGIVGVIEAVAAELGQPIRRMTSGAGHDAQMIARICPAAMIFVPSIDGVSHNPREDTSAEHLEIGANTLLHVMLRLAGTRPSESGGWNRCR